MAGPRFTMAAAALVAATGLAALAPGCGPPARRPQPAEALAYEVCNNLNEHGGIVPGQACRTPGTVCQGFCTRPCRSADDCPTTPGRSPTCERFIDGALCVIPCHDADDNNLIEQPSQQCPAGTYCRTLFRIDGSKTHACL